MIDFFLSPVPRGLVNRYKGTRIEKEIPEMLAYLELWGSNTTKLWAVHITLGVIATFFSLLTASQIGHIDDQIARIFGFIAALAISLMTAFNLGAKSNNTRNAWRRLNTAIMKFNENLMSKNGVIAAYEQGESLIGGVSFSQDRIEYEPLVSDTQTKTNVKHAEDLHSLEKKNSSENKEVKKEKP
jgi:hypothetical protein